MPLILASEATQVLNHVAKELGSDFFQKEIVCITTAGVPCEEQPWITDERNALRALGASTRDLELSRLSPSEVQSALENSERIFVHGGNTFFLLQEMQRIDFKAMLIPYLASGRSYIGSSAGSLVIGPRIDIIASTDDPSQAPMVDATKGLGLIDVVPYVHFDIPSYFPAFKTSFELALKQGINILPLRNDQYLFVEGKDFRLVTASE